MMKLFILIFCIYFIYHANAGKADEKCNEYSHLVKDFDKEVKEQRTYPVYMEKKPAEEKEFPHMAHVGSKINDKIEWFCGGSLISDQFILTLASCLERNPATHVRLGTTKTKPGGQDPNLREYTVEKTVIHPNYDGNTQTNDIALLKLNNNVEYSDYIRPACIHTSPNIDSDTAVAAEWENYLRDADNLARITMDLWKKDTCELYFANNKLTFNEDVICTNRRTGTRGVCMTDGGGPLQVYKRREPNIYSIIGIVPLGKVQCSRNNPLELPTRISSFIPWIEEVVWS